MTKPTRITLVRHGETIWNREMRLQGSRDIPLSEVGLQQAEAVAKRLQEETHHRVYSSHLQRAHKTAETIATLKSIPHHVHEDLQERSYGELEGFTREQILERYPDFWDHDREDIPGVETMSAARKRALNMLNQIADDHSGEHVLVVSHGGTINAFLHAISGGNFGTGVNKLGNTSISRVLRDEQGEWHIESVGDTSHLDGLKS